MFFVPGGGIGKITEVKPDPKAEALGAAAPYIKPFQTAVKAEHDYTLSLDKKYHAETVKKQLEDFKANRNNFAPDEYKEQVDRVSNSKPGELDTMNSWTKEESVKSSKLGEARNQASKNLRNAMIPVIKKYDLTLEKPKLEGFEPLDENGQKHPKPNGYELMNQIESDLARQAIAVPDLLKTPEVQPMPNMRKNTGQKMP